MRFAYRLALALGIPHPDYLLGVLTARQFVGWMAYHSLEPFSPVEAVVGEVLAGLSGGKRPRKVSGAAGKVEKQSADEMKKILDTIFFGNKKKHGR